MTVSKVTILIKLLKLFEADYLESADQMTATALDQGAVNSIWYAPGRKNSGIEMVVGAKGRGINNSVLFTSAESAGHVFEFY